MSREKQIEGINNEFNEWLATTTKISFAEWLYDKDYRKQSDGEWKTALDGTHWCSECGHDATYTFDGTEICGVACPFCGAKMKGGAE